MARATGDLGKLEGQTLSQIGYEKLSTLELWPRNYRKGDVDAVARSIERFGFASALRVRGNVVYAGNHSLKALLKLRKAKRAAPSGVLVEGGEWLIPVIRIDHLSETEAEAFAIADNRLQDLGSHDDEALRALLSEIHAEDQELAQDAGFTSEQLKGLLGELESQPIAQKSETAKPAEFLKWKGASVQISEEERALLDGALEEYTEKHGTSFGFVGSILGV